MGFDVYGVNPKIEQEYPPRYEEILKEYGNDGWLDYSKEIPQDVKDEYYNIKSITLDIILETMCGGGDHYGHLFVRLVMIS